MAEKRAQQVTVGANQEYQDFSHCSMMPFQCRSSLFLISSELKARISRLTIITMSRSGRRCRLVRKLSRIKRLIALRFTARATCFRAIANPMRGQLPGLFPTRMVIQLSLRRKLFLNTCWKSLARVNLSCTGKDSPTTPATLWREASSALGPTRTNHTASGAGAHARAKAVRPGTLEITRLKCTFHGNRLDPLVCRFPQGATMYW